jgi:pimeloyl-ACP methyl ester carboxylesterase
MKKLAYVVGAVLLAGLGGNACFIKNDGDAGGGASGSTGGTGGTPSGKGIGLACTGRMECRAPLDCSATTKTCQPDGMGVPGRACIVSADCLPALYCSDLVAQCTARVATPAIAGASCVVEGDCAAGLTCVRTGLAGICATAGTGDLGAACTSGSQCLGGLFCAAGSCQSFLSIPRWTGATCSTTEEVVPKIHFEIPRASAAPHEDYFRLPFPSDARLVNGKLSMRNFPTPGVRLLPFDPIDRYKKAIEADIGGFALNGSVFLRFSRLVDSASLKADGLVTLWNIDKRKTDYNSKVSHRWSYNPNKANYICPRALTILPGWERDVHVKLQPDTTYAVVIKNTATQKLLDTTGSPFQRDADFDAMLSATAPVDAELTTAWMNHKPLRDWITETAQDPKDFMVAAVFTTQKVEDPLVALRKATTTLAAPMATVTKMVKCGEASAVSPCDDGKTGADKTRGCLAAEASASYDEYQGQITFPIWQQGTRPYENPENGGAIQYDANGAPTLNATTPSESVCFSLTVPKSTMPAGGWPVAVYGHGTTGSYLSGRNVGWSQAFAAGAVPGGAAVPMAMISYDGALHGTRTGTTTLGVEELVFNILNPQSARDTQLQAAADLFVMAKVASSFDQMGVKLDPAKVVLYGHSQGANAAAMAAGYEPIYKSVVLSGSGGFLAQSLVSKQKPINIAAALPVIIGEPVDAKNPVNHPLITVLQTYFERGDPLNMVSRIALYPRMDVGAKNLLHVFGTMDTYAPEVTQAELAKAAGVALAGTAVYAAHGLPIATAPFSGNLMHGTTKFTALQIQYAPAGYDGHFVSTMDTGAKAAVVQSLGSTLRDGVSTVTR